VPLADSEQCHLGDTGTVIGPWDWLTLRNVSGSGYRKPPVGLSSAPGTAPAAGPVPVARAQSPRPAASNADSDGAIVAVGVAVGTSGSRVFSPSPVL
jgi:hypothetical protein